MAARSRHRIWMVWLRGLEVYSVLQHRARCPTRASFADGLYPHQAGIGHMMDDHGQAYPGYRGNLQPNCRTIAQVLKGAGYRNYAAGKWHVTLNIKNDGPKHNWPLQRVASIVSTG